MIEISKNTCIIKLCNLYTSSLHALHLSFTELQSAISNGAAELEFPVPAKIGIQSAPKPQILTVWETAKFKSTVGLQCCIGGVSCQFCSRKIMNIRCPH